MLNSSFSKVSAAKQVPVGLKEHESAWRDVGTILEPDDVVKPAKIGVVRLSGTGRVEICFWEAPKSKRLVVEFQDSAVNLDRMAFFETEPGSSSGVRMGGTISASGEAGSVSLFRLPPEGCRLVS